MYSYDPDVGIGPVRICLAGSLSEGPIAIFDNCKLKQLAHRIRCAAPPRAAHAAGENCEGEEAISWYTKQYGQAPNYSRLLHAIAGLIAISRS